MENRLNNFIKWIIRQFYNDLPSNLDSELELCFNSNFIWISAGVCMHITSVTCGKYHGARSVSDKLCTEEQNLHFTLNVRFHHITFLRRLKVAIMLCEHLESFWSNFVLKTIAFPTSTFTRQYRKLTFKNERSSANEKESARIPLVWLDFLTY